MRKHGIEYLLTFFFLSTFLSDAQPVTRRVLFIGNSYTYVNNLPQIISDFAASVSDTLIFDYYAPGGYTLDQHYQDSMTHQKIESGGWDYVVMQEQSQLPSFDFYYSYGAHNLCLLSRQYNPCARDMFYMTWGRKNGDASNCAVWPPVCTYEGMDSLLRLRYIEMAGLNNADVSPVGAVWRHIRHNYPGIELYQPDESHPSTAGSYAAACCFYSVLFGKDPTLSSYDYSLLSTDAASIRGSAKAVAYDSLQFWRLTDRTPTAAFTYVVGHGTNEVIITNQSTNAENYQWDFGDGTFSTLKNPSHNYSADGNYTITLTSSNCDLSQIYQDNIQKNVTFCSHSPTIFPDSLLICPNSSDTISTQIYDAYQWFDEMGNAIPGETNQYLLASPWMTYSVLATSNNCSEMSPQSYVSGFSTGLVIYWVDIFGLSNHTDTICMGDTITLVLSPNKPDGPDSHYQWYENGVALSSATDDTLIVTTSGEYRVKVTNSYCPGYTFYQSDSLYLEFMNCNIDIPENAIAESIKVFPNPTDNNIKISVNRKLVGSIYSLYDIAGSKIKLGTLEGEMNYLKIENLPAGIYFLKINNFSGCTKIIKTQTD